MPGVLGLYKKSKLYKSRVKRYYWCCTFTGFLKFFNWFFCKFGINLSVKVNWKDKEFIQGGSLNECNFDFSIIYWHKKQFWCFNASYKCSLCLILSVPLNNLPPISIFQLLSCHGLTDDFQTSRRFSKIIAIFHFSFDLSSLSQRPYLSTRFLVRILCVHNKLMFFFFMV